MSYLAIQAIQIAYTDDQRGRVDAENRQRIRALPIAPIAGDGVLHDCWIDQRVGNLEPRTTTNPIRFHDGDVPIHDALRLRVEDSVLVFVRDAGAEVWKTKPIFATAPNQWGRVIWNAKDANHDVKWLLEFVLNAGLFAAPPPSQIFLGTPTSERDLRRDFLRNGYR